MEKSLSTRFVSCYNRIDEILHDVSGLEPVMSFTACVRAASEHNATVKRFADDLTAYARLRNAIVHSSVEDKIIAEPHLDVVEHFESILTLLTHPPLVTDVIGERRVVCVQADDRLARVVELVYDHNFSNIPVLSGGKLVGLITPKDVVRAMGEWRESGGELGRLLASRRIADVKRTATYRIAPSSLTVAQAIEYFAQPKLRAVVLTGDGTATGRIT